MVEQLFAELSALPEVEAIALGGSRATDHYDEKSDSDVYLYCTGDIPEETRAQILSQYCGRMEIGNHFWEYEDNCTLRNGIDIDIFTAIWTAFPPGLRRWWNSIRPGTATPPACGTTCSPARLSMIRAAAWPT